MMFPCPGFPPAFFALLTDNDDAGVFPVFAGGVGSSSEKDSQAGSSFVTVEER